MTDPAVGVAQRVWRTQKIIPFSKDSPWVRGSLLPAAREAFAPIRDLHQSDRWIDPDGPDDFKPYCVGCMKVWPCDTAKLVYAAEEL